MKIVLEEYHVDWAHNFYKEKETIASVLADFNPTIEHIGSTSVVGLCAKPTIDILVGLHNATQLDQTSHPMMSKGYTYFRKYEPVMPYRRLFAHLKALTDKLSPEIIDLREEFVRGQEFIAIANIHIIVKDTLHWKRHLAFRDFLRAHPDQKDEYGRLKKELSMREFKDSNDYNSAKNYFVKKTQAQALAWYNDQNTTDESS